MSGHVLSSAVLAWHASTMCISSCGTELMRMTSSSHPARSWRRFSSLYSGPKPRYCTSYQAAKSAMKKDTMRSMSHMSPRPRFFARTTGRAAFAASHRRSMSTTMPRMRKRSLSFPSFFLGSSSGEGCATAVSPPACARACTSSRSRPVLPATTRCARNCSSSCLTFILRICSSSSVMIDRRRSFSSCWRCKRARAASTTSVECLM
mmetsp:Transcript_12472/g.37402  ORF Transcript_12472/g.37402 Transcript_12472/m.37402 type:complete len:206 (-) Transcript_12472:3281-3898(-)